MKKVSIIVPVYNVEKYLTKCLDSLVNQTLSDIEIIIVNDGSPDNSKKIIDKYLKEYPDKIKYINQQTPIYADEHIFKTLDYASGKYCKLNNDTCSYEVGALDSIVEYLSHKEEDCIFLYNKNKKHYFQKRVSTLKDFVNLVSYNSTYIGSFCIKKEVYHNLSNPLRYTNLRLTQVDIYGQLFENNYSALVWCDKFFNPLIVEKKGGSYNVAEVFGNNYFTILSEYIGKHNGMSNIVLSKEKSKIVSFINSYYFDEKSRYAFEQSGYFRYMFPIFKFCPKFYFAYLYHLLRLVFYKIISVQKNDTHKILKIFGVIKLKILLKNANKNNWRKKNKHNKTRLVENAPHDRIIVGNGTYGPIHAIFSSDGTEKLKIGHYCSIAPDVKFIVSSEHKYNVLSTYPFKVYNLGYESDATSKGDIVVKDDVWIGTNVTILSGVTIGQGAIIGAGAVVTKDVPPYAIVAGNPAKVVKYRFEQEVIDKLLKFDFSKLSDKKIKSLGTRLYTEITKENAEDLIREFQE